MNFKYLLAVSTFSSIVFGAANFSHAENVFTTIYMIDESGIGEELGTVTITDTEYGLLLTPDLQNLPGGIHGFHLHENTSCDAGMKDGELTPGLAAGGHYDPENTGSHEGPYGEGHLGDLPPLFANEDGIANTPILAPRLYSKDVKERSLIVHLHGDNFSDSPEKLGGGGGRLACGIIE